MKTDTQIVEAHRHQIGGLIADAFTTDAKGGDLSIRMRESFRKIDQIILAIIRDARGDLQPDRNGTAAPTQKVTK